MPEQIRDGGGSGYLARVNNDGQLITRATAVEQRLHSAVDQNYYEATTGQIILTDGVETPMIYIKNLNVDPNKVLVIDRVFLDFWPSTDGVGSGILEYYRNPTVVGGTDMDVYNTNFSSGIEPTGTFVKQMTTMTGDEWWATPIIPNSAAAIEEGRFVLPQGRGFGISVQAPASNTSMRININVAMYIFDITLIQ